MVTIFTIPKAFRGHESIIQSNAIRSWLAMNPPAEVILFGDDDGVAAAAKKFNVLHVPEVEKNQSGLPFVGAAFNAAQRIARYDTLVYANADIIFMPDVYTAIKSLTMPVYLVCGRRRDLDVVEEIPFGNADWVGQLQCQLRTDSRLHGPSGIDYFIFPRGILPTFPSFVVGRPGWDNWLIYHARSRLIPVLDATHAITAIHQNHRPVYTHKEYEAKRSTTLAGGIKCRLTIREADWVLDRRGPRKVIHRLIYSRLAMSHAWRTFLSGTRIIRMRLRSC